MTNIPGTWQNMDHIEMIAEQGIMQESSVQKFPLGYKLPLADGRTFRYCENASVALAAGKLVGSPLSAAERDDAINAAAAVAIGATSFVFTAVGTIAANDFKEGFAHIVNDTGEGLQYKIKSNTAAAAASDYTVELYDPIVTALTATTDVILTKSLYKDLIIAPDDVLYIVGVPTIPVTADFFFWAQSGGVAMVLINGSTGVATTETEWHADVAAGTDGAALGTAGGAGGKQQIGYHMFDSTDAVSTEYWPIMLTIDH